MTTQRQFPEGMLGRKLGMTQVFTEEGLSVPVTVLEMGPNTILDVKKKEEHGYDAVQFGFAPKKPSRVNKAELGHFNRSAKGAYYFVKELRCDVPTLGWTELGFEVSVGDVFEADEYVDVTGTSIGRGFQGVFRRHNMHGQPMSRGTHEVRRHGGAIGNRKSPGRVFKNKKMPGHMGNERVTIQNLKVVAVRPEEGLILVRGNVPGPKGSFVEVKKAIKSYKGAVNRVPDSTEKSEEGNEGKEAA